MSYEKRVVDRHPPNYHLNPIFHRHLNHSVPFFARVDLFARVPTAWEEKRFEVGFVGAYFVV